MDIFSRNRANFQGFHQNEKDLSSEVDGFGDWIGHFLPGFAAAFSAFTKINVRGIVSKP